MLNQTGCRTDACIYIRLPDPAQTFLVELSIGSLSLHTARMQAPHSCIRFLPGLTQRSVTKAVCRLATIRHQDEAMIPASNARVKPGWWCRPHKSKTQLSCCIRWSNCPMPMTFAVDCFRVEISACVYAEADTSLRWMSWHLSLLCNAARELLYSTKCVNTCCGPVPSIRKKYHGAVEQFAAAPNCSTVSLDCIMTMFSGQQHSHCQFCARMPAAPLTYWGRDNMATISQTTLSSACSWLKMLEFLDWNFTEVCYKVPDNNIAALEQIMAWRRPGDKPLFEPMMVRLPTHICVTRPWAMS